MDNKEIMSFFERRKKRLLKKGYPWLTAYAWAFEEGMQRFITKPIVDKMKKFFWAKFAEQIKTIIDGRDGHPDHHQASHPDE